jgi:hypothetical protein
MAIPHPQQTSLTRTDGRSEDTTTGGGDVDGGVAGGEEQRWRRKRIEKVLEVWEEALC